MSTAVAIRRVTWRPGAAEAAGGLAVISGLACLAVGPVTAALALALPLLFGLSIAGWVVRPHLMVALMIPLLAVVPAGKIFLAPSLGVVKEILLAAAVAATVLVVRRRQGTPSAGFDRTLTLLVGAFLLVAVLNVPGRHDAAWLNVVRLTAKPLIWLLIGMVVDPSGKTYRWAARSLIATGCGVAVVGIGQQVVGPQRLVDLGYRWNVDVRLLDGRLRSFGTLDESFQYAAVLLLAAGVALILMRPGLARSAVLALLVLGVAVSLVRTSAVIVFALAVLVAIRHHRRVVAAGMLVAAVAALFVVVGRPGGQETVTRPSLSTGASLTNLNGRGQVWADAIDGWDSLVLGRGLGTFGGRTQLAPGTRRDADQPTPAGQYADSSYIATLASTGIVGLALLVSILLRLAVLARRAVRFGRPQGWVVAAALVVMLVDGLTRDSLWGFPNAIVGFTLIGLALGATSARAGGRHGPGGHGYRDRGTWFESATSRPGG